MQAQAYEGYFENGKFYAGGKPVILPERRKVYITVLEEPAQVVLSTSSPSWLEEVYRLLEDSDDEVLRPEDFPRMEFGREPIFFSDEG